MKKRMLVVVLLTVILLSGCRNLTKPVIKGEIEFSSLPQDNFGEIKDQIGPLELQVKMLREDNNSAYFAVNLPYNADIESIVLSGSGSIIIDLKPKPGMERTDPFHNLAPAYYKVLAVEKKYKEYFEPDNVLFSIQSKTLKPAIDYMTALSYAWDHMETDFTSTMDCMALFEDQYGYKLAYIFFFGDSENINRAGNELIQGVVAVDSQNGQLIEYRIYNRNSLSGVYRHGETAKIEGWKDEATLIVSGIDGEDFYLMDMDKNKTEISMEKANKYIEQYNQKTSSMTGYQFVQTSDTNEIGFVYTKNAYIEHRSSGKRITVDMPKNVYVVAHKWDKEGKYLYLATEMAEPSYGNDWTYYTLWSFSITDGTLKLIGGLPSKEFYLSTDGARLAYNGPESDLFIMNVRKLLIEDPILK